MSEEDSYRFIDWLGRGEFAWNIYTLTADDVVLDHPYRWTIDPQFQGACLELRQDELALDAMGCLDAPL